MSDIEFNCIQCDKPIVADETLVGEVTTCPSCQNTMVIPYPTIKPGMEIGEFIVLKKIGSGGMGEVWLANQPSLERRIALKILNPALVQNEDFIQRFNQEVRIAGRLNHPNLVTAYAAGSDKGLYYLASYFVDGVELKAKLALKKHLSEKEALSIVLDIAEALNYAWKKFSIIHRDIKPSNIMMDKDGTPMLMDLGISKSIDENTELTVTGFTVGTPHYMSPEQARGEKHLDCRADIYSLGATLFHVLTGQVPYKGDTLLEVLASLLSNPLPSARRLNPRISEPCEALLELMLAKDKNERPQDWDALITNIKRVMKRRTPNLPRPKSIGADEEAIKKARKEDDKKVIFILLSVLAVGVLALLLIKSGVFKSDAPKKDDTVVTIDGPDISQQPDLVAPADDDDVASNEDDKDNEPEKELPALSKEEFSTLFEAVKAASVEQKFAGDFDTAIDGYKKIMNIEGYKLNSVQITKLEIAIDVLESAKNKFKETILEDLKKEADKFVEEGEFEDAIDLYDKYDGRYAAELKEKLNSAAQDLRAEETEYLAELKKKEEEEEAARLAEEERLAQEQARREKISGELFENITSTLLGPSNRRNVYKDSYSDFELFDYKDEFPKTQEVLKRLSSRYTVIGLYFKEKLGEEISLLIDEIEVTGILKKVEDDSLSISVELDENVQITQKYKFSKLSSDIRRDAYENLGGAVYRVYRAIQEVRSLKYEREETRLSKYKFALESIDAISESEDDELYLLESAMKNEALTPLAEGEYKKLLRIVGVSHFVEGIEAELAAVLEVQISEQFQPVMMEEAIKKFKEAYGRTKFYKKRETIFTELMKRVKRYQQKVQKAVEDESDVAKKKVNNQISHYLDYILKETELTESMQEKVKPLLTEEIKQIIKLKLMENVLTVDSVREAVRKIHRETLDQLREFLTKDEVREISQKQQDYRELLKSDWKPRKLRKRDDFTPRNDKIKRKRTPLFE